MGLPSLNLIPGIVYWWTVYREMVYLEAISDI